MDKRIKKKLEDAAAPAIAKSFMDLAVAKGKFISWVFASAVIIFFIIGEIQILWTSENITAIMAATKEHLKAYEFYFGLIFGGVVLGKISNNWARS